MSTPADPRAIADQQDAARVLAGDTRAFEGIVRRWQSPLINLAYRFCRDRGRSEEMAQEAFHGGTTTILSVFTAETAVSSAEDSESQAHTAHMHALVSLYQALGGGWSKQSADASKPEKPGKALGAAS